MSIKVEFGGATFEVTTAREAVELYRLLRKESSKTHEASRVVAGSEHAGRTMDEKKQIALKALNILSDAGERGIDSKGLAKSLNLDTRKLAHIGNILRAFCKRNHLDPDSIFKRVQTRDGRTWYAGDNIDRAFRALKKTKESSLL